MTALNTALYQLSLNNIERATSESTLYTTSKNTHKLNSLEHVDASILPAKVLVLLSKYAKALKEHNGTIIQLSSIDVFIQVHESNLLCEAPLAQKIHRQLLTQVNAYINLGSMYRIGQKPTNQDIDELLEFTSESGRPVSLDLLVRMSPFIKASNTTNRRSVNPDDAEFSMPTFG